MAESFLDSQGLILRIVPEGPRSVPKPGDYDFMGPLVGPGKLESAATPAHNATSYANLKAQLRAEELQSYGFYKQNGGITEADFINEHAFSRHSYSLNVTSNQNRTQFDQNIDVLKLRTDTISNYDRVYSDIQTRATVYEKAYDFDISTTINDMRVVPTTNSSNVHKVIISPDPARSTQFPLAPRHFKGN
jgi:hypothetical protein